VCGIAGIVNLDGKPVQDDLELRAMGAVQVHRGPDGEGYHVSGNVGLGHRRLSIIDLATGGQPMSTEDGAFTVTFNGEIYNFLELRVELERKGHRFRTRSDTEVLLASYREWGDGCLPRFNGMFAFAIWDAKNQRLFAARDRFGKKPFFYYMDGERFLFASEMKAILACKGVRHDLDPFALDEYLTYSNVPAPRTIYRQIRKLEPAHSLLLENGKLTTRRYWEIVFPRETPHRPETEILEEFGSILNDAVRLRMISDVPLGAFLSGGLDSSAVVGLMAKLADAPVKTFTIGFEEQGYSEVEDARRIARHFGTNHEEFTVRPSATDILPDVVWHFDEPFGDSSAIPTYYVSKMAAQRVKVVLSGDGGDEVFGGYRRYLEALEGTRWSLIPEAVRRRLLLPLARRSPMGAPARNFLYFLGNLEPLAPGYRNGIFPYIKDRLYNEDFRRNLEGHNPFRVTDEVLTRSRDLDIVSRLQLLDISNYLPNDILVKVDRMSMAHSIELRSPLLDFRLLEFVAGLPPEMRIAGGVTKVLLRKYLKGLLPTESFRKPKQGFGIPKDSWFREELASYSREVVLSGGSLSREIFRQDTLQGIFDGHRKGKRDYSEWIWCLVILELWHRRFGRHVPVPA